MRFTRLNGWFTLHPVVDNRHEVATVWAHSCFNKAGLTITDDSRVYKQPENLFRGPTTADKATRFEHHSPN